MKQNRDVNATRNMHIDQLWNITLALNVLYRDNWTDLAIQISTLLTSVAGQLMTAIRQKVKGQRLLDSSGHSDTEQLHAWRGDQGGWLGPRWSDEKARVAVDFCRSATLLHYRHHYYRSVLLSVRPSVRLLITVQCSSRYMLTLYMRLLPQKSNNIT